MKFKIDYNNQNTSSSIIDDILNLETKFFVDIGASDSKLNSQTERLIENGWSGLSFECDSNKFKNLSERYLNNKKIKVRSDKITPENILNILTTEQVPDNFYLSIDIDGYDFFVLDKILSVYKPQLIISEINEKIPPPIKFSVLYHPDYFWDVSHFYGYSISMSEDLLKKYEYKISFLHHNNLVLTPGIHKDGDIEKFYYEGYYDTGRREELFPHNKNFNIYNMTDDEKMDFIKNTFVKYTGKYILKF